MHLEVTMRAWLSLALLALLGHPNLASADMSADEVAAAAFIEHFFEALDARDVQKIGNAFVPGAKIVHDDGAITTIPEMLDIVRSAKEWPPRSRSLSAFEFTPAGSALVAGCLNRVRFTPPGRAAVEYTYRETWVLVPTDDGWRAARSHYSAVTGSGHSEDVP